MHVDYVAILRHTRLVLAVVLLSVEFGLWDDVL